jgi:hypothetical protein
MCPVQVRLPTPPASPLLLYDDRAVFHAAYPPPVSDDSDGQAKHVRPMHLPRKRNAEEVNNHMGYAPSDYVRPPPHAGPFSNDVTGHPKPALSYRRSNRCRLEALGLSLAWTLPAP